MNGGEVMYECEVCGKEYKSRSGLSRHRRTKHAPQVEPAVQAKEAVRTSEVYGSTLLDRALEALAIASEDVLAYRVYHDRVVIIEGPVGYERVWMREGGSANGAKDE